MLMRKLALGLALSALLSVAGCKCCHSNCRPCESPAIVGAAPIQGPCNNCGGNPPPGVVAPPPGGGIPPGGPAYYPPGAPFGPSGRKI
jgi:hypothetical protein